MRKTSQDGGDSTSITSGVENEIKKPIIGIMKSKRNSIKRKVQNFSHESDEAVIEPLLQKAKLENSNQSAKCILPKSKTESSCEKGNDRDKLLSDERIEKPSLSNAPSVCGNTSMPNGTKETINHSTKLYESSSTMHNHMNTNVFSSLDDAKKIVTLKSQILVEIDGNKPTGYNPSPLIFTMAKIHTDMNTKSMEPVQVTPVPILSTIEGSVKMSMNKNLSGISDKGNNMVNTIYMKPNETEFKDTLIAKTSSTLSNFSPCILSSDNAIKKYDGMDSKIVPACTNTLSNHSVKPVDISNIPKHTDKSDFNTTTKKILDSQKVPLNIGSKDPFKNGECVVDIKKNIEANKTSSDNVDDDKKQLPIQNNPMELTSISGRSTDSKIIQKSIEKLIMEPQIVKTTRSETNLTKTNEKSNSLAKSVTVYTSTSLTSGSSIKNETNSTKIPITETNTIVKSTGTTITPMSNTFIETSLVSGAASITAVPTQNMVTNVMSTVKPTVSEKIMSTKATPVKLPASSLSIVKTAVTAKTPATKLPTIKTIPITTSIKTTSSQSASVNTVTISVSDVNSVSAKTAKSSEISSTYSKSNIKAISAIDSNKTLNRVQPASALTSSSSASNPVTVKKQERTNQTPKSTTSASKSSTSTIISKPATVSVTQSSFSIKQTSTKPTSTKLSNSSVSSVKTLITSSDKPSNSGSVKTITSTKSQNKQIESKGTGSNKKV